MRSKLTRILLLTAWLLATGAQWDVVQVLAWGRMFANNARVLPWREAWGLTFSPGEKCAACHAVQEARQDEMGGTTASAPTGTKEPLVFQAPVQIVVAAPMELPWFVVELGLTECERATPPTPPPRGLA